MSESTKKKGMSGMLFEMEDQIAQLTKERDELAAKIDPMWRELVSHRERAQGNYWGWDKEEANNHIESLSYNCPILIHAIDMRAILKERDDALALLGARKMTLDELRTRLDAKAGQAMELAAKCASLEKQFGTCSICGFVAWKDKDARTEECEFCKLSAKVEEMRQRITNCHDRLLRGDSDTDLLKILEAGYAEPDGLGWLSPDKKKVLVEALENTLELLLIMFDIDGRPIEPHEQQVIDAAKQALESYK